MRLPSARTVLPISGSWGSQVLETPPPVTESDDTPKISDFTSKTSSGRSIGAVQRALFPQDTSTQKEQLKMTEVAAAKSAETTATEKKLTNDAALEPDDLDNSDGTKSSQLPQEHRSKRPNNDDSIMQPRTKSRKPGSAKNVK